MISLLARTFTPRLFSSIHPRNPSSAAKQCAGGAWLQASSSFVHMCKNFATLKCVVVKKRNVKEKKRSLPVGLRLVTGVHCCVCWEELERCVSMCLSPLCVVSTETAEVSRRAWFAKMIHTCLVMVCGSPCLPHWLSAETASERRAHTADWWTSYRRWD